MFGSIGTNVNVVFKVMLLIVFLNISPFRVEAANFNSNDIFSRSIVSSESYVPIKSSFKDNSSTSMVLIFIDPQCSWCLESLKNLSSFQRTKSKWRAKVYVMGSLEEVIGFFRKEMPNLPADLEYTLDFRNIYADKYKVRLTPTYIVIDQGKIKKVEGYVDLVHFILDGNA